MAKKVKFTFKDATDKELFSFYSKTATKEFGKMAQGTPLKVFCDEGKDFGEQFIGDMVVKGLPEGPAPPPDVNTPPKVNAGEDISVKQGSTVNMDGSAVDTDGTIERVEWHQLATGVPMVQLIADSSDATNVSFTAPDVPAGQTDLVLEFMLEAFDDKGASAVDKIKVTITTDTPPPPPPPPVEGTIWKDKWGNGNERVIKGVAVDPDDPQFEMRAGASVDGVKELDIDGKGIAVCTGERYRAYIWNKPNAGSQGGAE